MQTRFVPADAHLAVIGKHVLQLFFRHAVRQVPDVNCFDLRVLPFGVNCGAHTEVQCFNLRVLPFGVNY